MPQIETRVILVQEAGKQEELIKALKVLSFSFCKRLFFFHQCVNNFIVFLISYLSLFSTDY